MSIPLSQLINLSNPNDYKVHLARYDHKNRPLDVFVQDKEEWDNWNRWRSNKDDFNRTYILALIDFHLESNVWLFGGIYKVLSREPTNQSYSYTVERSTEHSELIGRLKIRYCPSRGRSFRLENCYANMSLSEILREAYTGEQFPGYEDISHDFGTLESVFRTCRPDWKAALENIKGVYLITDKKNGKMYVGSAYGGTGIWSRWRCYLETGHGGNCELSLLIKREGIEYAKQNFQMSLLEYRPAKTDDNVILAREAFWKKTLQTQGDFGYNRN